MRRPLGRARFDLRQCFGRLEERALHDSVRVEQVVAPAAQLVDLRLEQTAAAEQIGEHALTRRLGLVEHVATLLTRGFDQLFGLAFGALALLGRVRLDRGADLGRVLFGLGHDRGRALLGFVGARLEVLVGLAAPALGFGGCRLGRLGGLLLGPRADLVGGLARRPEQPARLGAERVEQLRLVEGRGDRSCSSSASMASSSSASRSRALTSSSETRFKNARTSASA